MAPAPLTMDYSAGAQRTHALPQPTTASSLVVACFGVWRLAAWPAAGLLLVPTMLQYCPTGADDDTCGNWAAGRSCALMMHAGLTSRPTHPPRTARCSCRRSPGGLPAPRTWSGRCHGCAGWPPAKGPPRMRSTCRQQPGITWSCLFDAGWLLHPIGFGAVSQQWRTSAQALLAAVDQLAGLQNSGPGYWRR
jgi:hypothetical protein